MPFRSILAAGVAALSLAACSTISPTVHEDAGKTLIAAEGALDAAVIAADVAVKARVTTAAQDGAIAKLTAPCPSGAPITLAVAQASCPVVGGLYLARAAYTASDAATYTQLTANLLALASALGALH